MLTYSQLALAHPNYSSVAAAGTFEEIRYPPNFNGTVSGSSSVSGSVTGSAGRIGSISGSSTLSGSVVGIEGSFGDPVEPSIVVSGSITGSPSLSGLVAADNGVYGTVVGIEGDFGDPVEPTIVSSGSASGVLEVSASVSGSISVSGRVSGFPTFPNVASEYVPKKVRATQIRIERFGEVVGFSIEDGKVRGIVTYPGTILGLDLETSGKAIGTPTVLGSTFAVTTKAAARIGGSVWLRGPEEEQLLDLLGVL